MAATRVALRRLTVARGLHPRNAPYAHRPPPHANRRAYEPWCHPPTSVGEGRGLRERVLRLGDCGDKQVFEVDEGECEG